MSVCLLSVSVEAADTMTGVFHPDFKSLQVKVEGNDQLPAFIVMDSSDHIEISFDELADERRYMRYEIEHCDHKWRPDGLISSMFLDGFNVNDVTDYRYSQATTINYIHYTIRIPNEDVRLKVSGNYLLKVYDESDPETILLQARFQVSENTAGVLVSATPRTDIDYQDAHQQISVVVDPKSINIQDPYRDMYVTVQQNSRPDMLRIVPAPMRISADKYYYEHHPSLIFPAGNEYRRFETVTVNYPSMRVEEMSYSEPFYHATLYTDEPRNEQKYVFDKTQHGRYRVRQFNSDDSDVAADYVLTHFTLDMDEIRGADIFLDGDFTNRRHDASSRMVFDRGHNRYEGAALLKQGSYNYQYVVVPEGSETGITATIEGDKYQTVNEYTVCVYYHKPGELYDRLLGFANILSN